ncbi:helix-turn-helix transcriptional regulator [Arthrobacter sp. KBS0703]|uniref:helix-turn-helix domain-containing protein n=1 Tax=Arthrobacter sp. KBS0703 TaxID=1955698 RepID=UPI00098FDC37|nr:helix-turn-helix transcriptional regulator [Arthrobacter sp. KBS0703]TSE15760.1 helix-turn-helix transcriptional regulator [Arthrobacter sp. KBS0703]
MKVVGYEWRLREVMAAAGMFTTTKLIPALRERGIDLSSSQVYRLVTEKPDRLNLQVMVALMDIFDCSADDLVRKVDLGASSASTGTGGPEQGASADFLRERGLRPKRAQILPHEGA